MVKVKVTGQKTVTSTSGGTVRGGASTTDFERSPPAKGKAPAKGGKPGAAAASTSAAAGGSKKPNDERRKSQLFVAPTEDDDLEYERELARLQQEELAEIERKAKEEQRERERAEEREREKAREKAKKAAQKEKESAKAKDTSDKPAKAAKPTAAAAGPSKGATSALGAHEKGKNPTLKKKDKSKEKEKTKEKQKERSHKDDHGARKDGEKKHGKKRKRDDDGAETGGAKSDRGAKSGGARSEGDAPAKKKRKTLGLLSKKKRAEKEKKKSKSSKTKRTEADYRSSISSEESSAGEHSDFGRSKAFKERKKTITARAHARFRPLPARNRAFFMQKLSAAVPKVMESRRDTGHIQTRLTGVLYEIEKKLTGLPVPHGSSVSADHKHLDSRIAEYEEAVFANTMETARLKEERQAQLALEDSLLVEKAALARRIATRTAELAAAWRDGTMADGHLVHPQLTKEKYRRGTDIPLGWGTKPPADVEMEDAQDADLERVRGSLMRKLARADANMPAGMHVTGQLGRLRTGLGALLLSSQVAV